MKLDSCDGIADLKYPLTIKNRTYTKKMFGRLGLRAHLISFQSPDGAKVEICVNHNMRHRIWIRLNGTWASRNDDAVTTDFTDSSQIKDRKLRTLVEQAIADLNG